MFFGVFVIQQFVGGGFGMLTDELKLNSFPFLLVGLIPLVVGVIGRMVVIPAARTEQDFMTRLIICLACCEMPVFIGIFVLAPELTTEKAFAFIGSTLGMLLLFPMTITHQKNHP